MVGIFQQEILPTEYMYVSITQWQKQQRQIHNSNTTTSSSINNSNNSNSNNNNNSNSNSNRNSNNKSRTTNSAARIFCVHPTSLRKNSSNMLMLVPMMHHHSWSMQLTARFRPKNRENMGLRTEHKSQHPIKEHPTQPSGQSNCSMFIWSTWTKFYLQNWVDSFKGNEYNSLQTKIAKHYTQCQQELHLQ